MGTNMISGEIIGEDGRKEIELFDTTLRDGHQCPGAAVENDNDYFDIVRGIDGIGINVSEVGFPASSKHEEWRVNQVAEMCKNGEISTMVCGLTQMVDFQVEACLRALEPAMGVKKAMFHIYYPVDPVLRAASIGNKMSDDQAIKDVARFTKMATDMGAIVMWSGEGYSRLKNAEIDNFNFTTDLIRAAIENGATYINGPDTIGGEDPNNTSKEYYVDTLLRHKSIIDEEYPDNEILWSVHNHNDLGLAAQNSINAVKKGTGISMIQGTINGIGERAGNADLIQVIARMKTMLSEQFNIDAIQAREIGRVSDMVARLMLPVQPNYPIVGGNASKHTSGGHANAILKNPMAYQPFNPEIFGRSISLVYGPNSGGNLAASIVEEQGYICGNKDERRNFDRYAKAKMQETGRYKGVTDEELLGLYKEFRSPIRITGYKKEDIEGNEEKIRVQFDGEIFGEIGLTLEGETVFTSLKDYISEKIPGYKIGRYSSVADEEGSRSILTSKLPITHAETGEKIEGIGKDKDIETSSLKALANAFNQIYIENNYKIDSTQ